MGKIGKKIGRIRMLVWRFKMWKHKRKCGKISWTGKTTYINGERHFDGSIWVCTYCGYEA